MNKIVRERGNGKDLALVIQKHSHRTDLPKKLSFTAFTSDPPAFNFTTTMKELMTNDKRSFVRQIF